MLRLAASTLEFRFSNRFFPLKRRRPPAIIHPSTIPCLRRSSALPHHFSISSLSLSPHRWWMAGGSEMDGVTSKSERRKMKGHFSAIDLNFFLAIYYPKIRKFSHFLRFPEIIYHWVKVVMKEKGSFLEMSSECVCLRQNFSFEEQPSYVVSHISRFILQWKLFNPSFYIYPSGCFLKCKVVFWISQIRQLKKYCQGAWLGKLKTTRLIK